jgi:glycosyltransferase involved in cell wall biosynthesis
MKVFGWLADHEACGYYRIKLPLDTWRVDPGGVQASYSRLLPTALRSPFDGILIGQRLHLPGPLIKWEQFSGTGRPRLVYEIDDNLLDIDPSISDAYRYFNQPQHRDGLIRGVKAADVVITSTEPLAQALQPYHHDIRMVPNMVDEVLLRTDSRPPPQSSLRIGWQGSWTHEKDWALVVPALRRLLQDDARVTLHTWGAGYAAQTLRRTLPIVCHGWEPDIYRYYAGLKMDIGLAPLHPSVFNRSKSHIRVLEMAALGIPVVASDFGPYAEFVRHGETGLLVRRDHEWYNHLRALVADPAMRQDMSINARKLAAQHTIQVGINQWVKAITE